MTGPNDAEVLRDLGFLLAIDGCARGCEHCPAFGSSGPVSRTPLPVLVRRAESLARGRALLGLPAAPERTVHCWRISDPLDYWSRLGRGPAATAGEVALVWREYLRQGLYVVTNGSEGRSVGRRALAAFAALPDLVSQIKLTLTPADPSWGTARYIEDLADDVRTLLELWELPADRPEAGADALRFRLNVKTTDDRRDEARAVTATILRAAGIGRKELDSVLDDPNKVAFKPIYDLGTAVPGQSSPVLGAITVTDDTGQRNKPTPEARPRIQYGIRPDGRVFEINLYAFVETDLTADGRPLLWSVDQAAEPVAAHA